MRHLCNLKSLLLPIAILLSTNFAFAESPSEKWQNYIKTYANIAFASGTRESLRRIEVSEAIPMEINCSIPSEISCKKIREIISHNVQIDVNFRFRFDVNPIIRIEFFDKTNADAIRKVAEEEFAGGISDVSDIDCEMFIRLEGSNIIHSKVLISSEQAELKLRACLIVQVGQAVGLGPVDGGGFATIWSHKPYGLSDLDDHGIRLLRDTYGFDEYLHMCPELHAGMKLEEVKAKLELPDSCISKIGGIK